MNEFHVLLKSGLGFDEISLSGAFSACAVIEGHLEGMHVQMPFWTCMGNVELWLQLVVSLMKWKEEMLSLGMQLLQLTSRMGMKRKLCRCLFGLRMEPDEFTFGSVLKACAGKQALSCGIEIHDRIIKSGMGLDSFVGSALVDMYCKCAKVEEAEKIHDRMEEKTMVSWNAIISGYSMHEQSEEAEKFFSWMLEMGVKPDNFTYATILDSCANLVTVGLGKQIHAQIIKQELQSDVYIASTLVDMYSKCGNMHDSRLMFEKGPKRDFVTWNAMICGYAQHGLGEEALGVFENMQHANVKPNHATFVVVLRACAHMGLVEKGSCYFHSMLTNYGLYPQLEHYSCMVDLLGRPGQVGEALKLIHDMPFEADDVIWRTLLSICKMHGNVDVAEKAANSLLQLDPQDSAAYIILSNIYADAGMWDEVSKMRKMMRYTGLKKEPGCSWIEVKSEVHMFLVGDKAHPRCEEIYETLDVLINEMKWAGYVPDIEFVFDDEAAEDEHQELYPACTATNY